jgi:hypothetical protein
MVDTLVGTNNRPGPRTRGDRFPEVLARLILVLLALAVAAPGLAQTTASSSALGERTDLSFAPLLGGGVQAHSGPLPAVAGAAPPGYAESGSAASVNVTLAPLGAMLRTGLLEVGADSALPAADEVTGRSGRWRWEAPSWPPPPPSAGSTSTCGTAPPVCGARSPRAGWCR